MRIIAFARTTALLAAISFAIPVVGQQETGFLKVSANPGRAGVFIDDKYVGPSANFRIDRRYTVAAGTHEVKLCDPRYEDVVRTVTIEPGKTTRLKETLKRLPPAEPPFGRLRTVSSDKFAAVLVNDKFMGHADEFSNSMQGLLLNPGEYTVKLVPAGGTGGSEERVKIEADRVSVVRLQ